MKKTTYNVRELINKHQSNCDRIKEIADVCEREERGRNEAENKEFEALTRENQLLVMKMQAATADHLRENPTPKPTRSALSARIRKPANSRRSFSCAI